MNIVCPSAGRASMVLTAIEGMILCIEQGEHDAYRYHNPAVEIDIHPPLKNLAAKRQWIYERYRDVFMVDDDISFVSRLYTTGNNRDEHLSPFEIAELIQVTADSARAAGCYLFGFNQSPNAKHYYPHKPIELTGYINACAFGLFQSDKLYFTERTTAAESHWINLLNARVHRKAWIDKRFHFAQAPNSTFYREGGQTAKRTLASEREDTLFLRRMFGQAVQVKKNRGDANLVHQYQRSIKVDL